MQEKTAQKKKRLAVFDYDGTSIDGQSGLLFSLYLWHRGLVSVPRAAALVWWGVRYKLHLPQRQDEAREIIFASLSGLDAEDVDKIMHEFHNEVLLPRYRPQAVAEVKRRHEEGCVTLLVSATFEPIAADAAEALGVDAHIATDMEKDANNRYTGRVRGPVVQGYAKVAVVRRWADEHFGRGNWVLSYAYGDHHTDEELLASAGRAYAVCPGPTLRKEAHERGWDILDWE